MVLHRTRGYPEIILMGACDIAIFYITAQWLQEKINADFHKQVKEGGKLRWQFSHFGMPVILSFEDGVGVSLYPSSGKNATENELGCFDKLFKVLQSI